MIKKLRFWGIIFVILTITSCSTVINKQKVKLSLDKKYAIASFWNYTETPMAGLRASTIVESVLAKSDLSLISLIDGSEELENINSKKSFLIAKKSEAKSLGLDYLITGSVQEWRYKTGIDGEPVVSFSINIIDLKRDKVLFSGVGAKSAWGHKSIGVVAQEIAEKLAPQFIK